MSTANSDVSTTPAPGCSFRDLPIEVLIIVVEHTHPSWLSFIRTICKSLEPASRPRFAKIYFSECRFTISKQGLARSLNITNSPGLCKHIRKVLIGDSMIREMRGGPDSHLSALIHNNDVGRAQREFWTSTAAKRVITRALINLSNHGNRITIGTCYDGWNEWVDKWPVRPLPNMTTSAIHDAFPGAAFRYIRAAAHAANLPIQGITIEFKSGNFSLQESDVRHIWNNHLGDLISHSLCLGIRGGPICQDLSVTYQSDSWHSERQSITFRHEDSHLELSHIVSHNGGLEMLHEDGNIPI